MKNKTKIITLFLLITLFMASTTAVVAAETLNLDEAVNLLLQKNRSLENSRKDIEKSAKDLDLAGRSYFPTLDLQTSYTKMSDAQPAMKEDPSSPLGFTFAEGSDENYTTSLSLSQPLWLGGKVGMQKEISAYGLEIAKAQYQQTVEEQIFSLIQAYYGVLQAEGMVEIREDALDIVNEHLRIVENNLEAGITIRRDLLQSQIKQRDSAKSLKTAQNNLEIARRRLLQLLNTEQDFELKQPAPDFDIELKHDKLYQQAVKNDSQSLALELNEKITELNKKLQGQYYRPNVALNGKYQWQGDEFLAEDSWNLTVAVSVPLYDGGKGSLNADKQQKELEKIENKRQSLLENIDIETEESLLNIAENKETIELEKLSLENAEENLEIANKSYEAGVASNTDVISAQSTYNQAQISLLQAEYSYDIELFKTLYNTGILTEYFEEVINDEK